jgi:hypothetical protein
MAPKKNRKQVQETMLEEPAEKQVVPLESIGEEEQKPGRTKMSPKMKRNNEAQFDSPRNNWKPSSK